MSAQKHHDKSQNVSATQEALLHCLFLRGTQTRISEMKTITKIVTAAALFASTSMLALAQVGVGGGVDAGGNVSVGSGSDGGTSVGVDTGVNAGANVGTSGGDNSGSSVSGGVNASGNVNASATNADTNNGSIVSDLSASSMTIADLEAVDSDTEIEVLTISEIEGDAAENASAFQAAIEAQSQSLAQLTASIEANAAISAALEAKGFSSNDVVAVTATAEGDLTIIVDDSSN
jgi:hypothetical protein